MASLSFHYPVFAHFPCFPKASIWASQGPSGVRYRLPPRRWLSSHLLPRPGFGSFHSRCSITNIDVSISHVVVDTELPREDLYPVDSNPLLPIVHLKSEILKSDCLSLLAKATDVDCVLTPLPKKSKRLLQQVVKVAYPSSKSQEKIAEELKKMGFYAGIASTDYGW